MPRNWKEMEKLTHALDKGLTHVNVWREVRCRPGWIGQCYPFPFAFALKVQNEQYLPAHAYIPHAERRQSSCTHHGQTKSTTFRPRLSDSWSRMVVISRFLSCSARVGPTTPSQREVFQVCVYHETSSSFGSCSSHRNTYVFAHQQQAST